MTTDIANKTFKVASGNCGNEDCPKHGSKSKDSQLRSALKNGKEQGERDNTPCPVHGAGASSSGSASKQPHSHTMKVRTGTGKSVSSGNSSKTTDMSKMEEQLNDIEQELDGMLQNTKRMLRLSVPVSKKGGNSVVTIINNNHIHTESNIHADAPMPNVSSARPQGSRADEVLVVPSEPLYQEMKKLKLENLMLKHENGKQKTEIGAMQNQLKELQKNVLEDQQEKMKLKEKIKAMIKLTYKWNENLESSQKEIEVLRSKVRYAEMKSQQLRRMASENASTASKWRAKAMESLEAQKELEEKKNAAEKAALEFYVDENSNGYQKFAANIGRRPITEIIDSSMDISVGPLDTTMIGTPPPAVKTVTFVDKENRKQS